ncbi:FAD-dependent oxidoreductase [Acinetobacter bereziniae]|uniref:FAD-dependent oxidoreductase n=2 Tax=Acinetobacter TaxID=469 RepID=UPI0032B3E63A
MERLPLETLESQNYDVVIIGAGAVGCASARQLAGRGFKTLLIDRGDIGAGTSSRSSRMLYSGLGYLVAKYPLWQIPFHPHDMMQRLGYTAEVMRCRAELVQEMPHHLTKHTFFYPFRQADQYAPWLVNIGFKLVEGLGGWKVPLAYRRIDREAAEKNSALVAALDPQVKSVAVFEEYMYAWPERICVDTALDAEKRGATIRNYTEVIGINKITEHWNIQLRECAPEKHGLANVQAKIVINAAGPWVDFVPDAGGENQKRIIGIKGINVMVRLPEAFKGQGLEAFSRKGEPYYVFPWRDFHFIGPTESIFIDNPDLVKVEDHEIDYVLQEANFLFPQLQLTRKDVQHCWCGVRPTSTINGKDVYLAVRLSEHPEKKGILTVTGSTIMLHRHASRLVAQAVELRLGKRGGAPTGVIKENGMVLDDIEKIIREEHVVRLTDLIRRRLQDGLNPDLGCHRAKELSLIAAKVLGWSETRRLMELAYFDEDTQKVYRKINSLS